MLHNWKLTLKPFKTFKKFLNLKFFRYLPKIFWQIYMAPAGPPTNKNLATALSGILYKPKHSLHNHGCLCFISLSTLLSGSTQVQSQVQSPTWDLHIVSSLNSMWYTYTTVRNTIHDTDRTIIRRILCILYCVSCKSIHTRSKNTKQF